MERGIESVRGYREGYGEGYREEYREVIYTCNQAVEQQAQSVVRDASSELLV